MKKAISALLLMLVAILVTGMPILADELGGNVGVGGERLLELQELVLVMDKENQRAGRSVVDFSDDVYMGDIARANMADPRFVRLSELSHLFHEITLIQQARGAVCESADPFVIVGWGGAYSSLDGRFNITLLNKEYLDLLDFISEFTGIERDQMNVEVGGIIQAGEARPSVTELEYENIIELSDIPIPMGTRLTFRHSHNGAYIGTGTLAHPLSAFSRFALSTNHDMVPAGARVYATALGHIGYVAVPYFRANAGVDASIIELLPRFRANHVLPGTSISINNFNARVTSAAPQVTVITWNGNRNGVVNDFSYSGWVRMPDNRSHHMRNMLRANIDIQGGDSGASLVRIVGSNAQAVGLLIGSDGRGQSFYTQLVNMSTIVHRMQYLYDYCNYDYLLLP